MKLDWRNSVEIVVEKENISYLGTPSEKSSLTLFVLPDIFYI